jgi:hypothetical protein
LELIFLRVAGAAQRQQQHDAEQRRWGLLDFAGHGSLFFRRE